MLKMYVENEGVKEKVECTYVSRITDDENEDIDNMKDDIEVEVIAEYDNEIDNIDFSCLKNRVGEYIMVYENERFYDLCIIDSVIRDTKLEETLNREPVYVLQTKKAYR